MAELPPGATTESRRRLALRLLFALNPRWEPDWKWLRQVTEGLERAPERLADRVEQAFTLPDPWARVRVNHELILDTLALLPPSPGVERAQQAIRATLAAGVVK